MDWVKFIFLCLFFARIRIKIAKERGKNYMWRVKIAQFGGLFVCQKVGCRDIAVAREGVGLTDSIEEYISS